MWSLTSEYRRCIVAPAVSSPTFATRHRNKTAAELAGIRRAAAAAEAGLTATAAALRSGEPLTCERLRDVVRAAVEARGAALGDFIVSHGPQTATGHVARALLTSDATEADHIIAHVADETTTMIAELRRVVDDLRRQTLDQLGLATGIREHCARFARGAGLERVEVIAPVLPPLPAAVEVAAYRIAIEAVNNAARHSGRTNCRVELAIADGALRVEIRDDGRGLPRDYTAGVGLHSMGERAAELGGPFGAERLPAGGTLVRAALPFAPVEATI